MFINRWQDWFFVYIRYLQIMKTYLGADIILETFRTKSLDLYNYFLLIN